MTKRELLVNICENPGWSPAESSDVVDRHLSELRVDGWIADRLDGLEATPRALDAYPDFLGEGELANPDAQQQQPPQPSAVPGMVEDVRVRLHHAHAKGPSDEAVGILEILEAILMSIDQMQTEFDDYKGVVVSAFTAIDAALGNFEARVTELTTELQNAGIDPAKAAALSADIAQARTDATTELAKIGAADPGAAGGAVAGVAGSAVTGAADTAGAPTDATGGGTTAAVVPTEYLSTLDPATIDLSVWPLSVNETTEEPPRLLYTYTGDTNPGDQNGATVAGFEVYTGPTQPRPTT